MMRPDNIIIIGSSAGGPRILKELFNEFPRIDAAIVLVQHMPAFINKAFTLTLDKCTDMDVRLAEHGDRLARGSMYIAPTGKHLTLKNNVEIELMDGEKVNFVCPAVDQTMFSVKAEAGVSFIGVVLTGMGRDGAGGIVHIKALGGTTIAQDEESSVIYGMPREAIATGKVDYILPPSGIARKLISIAGTV